IPNFNEDAGRASSDPSLQELYGTTPKDVEKHLVKIKWSPKSQNKTLAVTKINDVDKILEAISNELENLPSDLKQFVV
ncbi:M15 family peptidase, partial [Aliarcobacter butzleri]